MKKVLLEFTLNGHKHTFFKRFDAFGKPVTTHNKNNARGIKEGDVPGVLKALIKEYGKDNVSDFNPINDND